MKAYYNELDSYPARWMQNLIAAGHIAPGYVDNRSIKDVTPNDLKTYTQAHFFAGIAGWSHALRLAGWPDDRPVWTGSCPCQPFSTAGKRGGTDDPRHLWPDWFRLIRECRPVTIFGEQVASKDGLAWLDLVYDDLESEGYSVAAFDLCAAGVGAPHIRQRLYFVAVRKDANGIGWGGRGDGSAPGNSGQVQAERLRGSSFLANAESSDRGLPVQQGQPRKASYEPERGGEIDFLAHTDSGRQQQRDAGERGISKPDTDGNLGDAFKQGLERRQSIGRDDGAQQPPAERAGVFWSELEWLPCRDGKARPTQPGLFPLAHGVPGRVGRLRAYGNAIVPPLAAEFIRACMEVLGK